MSDLANNLHVRQLKLAGFLLTLVGAGFSITSCAAGLGLYLAGLVLELTLDESYGHPRYPQGPILLLLISSLLISLFLSQYFSTSLRGLWKYAEGFILLYAAVDVIRSPKDLRIVVGVLTSVFFLAALSGVCQDILGFDFVYFRAAMHDTDTLPPRLIGSFKHYNDYSSFLVPGIALSMALLIYFCRLRRFMGVFFSLFFLGVSVYCLSRALSRSAILSAFVSLAALSLFFRCRWAALLGLITVFITLWFTPCALSVRFHDLLKGSTPERILLFKTSMAMIEAKPLFGLGLNTYSKYFPQFRPAGYPALMYAHNSYMQMAAEIGLIGLSLYLSFVASLLWRSVKSICSGASGFTKVWSIGLFSGILGMLVNAGFESLLQSTQLRALIWSLIGILLASTINILPRDISANPRA